MSLLPPGDPWAAYASTVVEIVRKAEGDFVTVCGLAPGRMGRWPWPTDEPVPILTAWDPGEERRGSEENRRLGAELASVLRPRAQRLLDAIGVDPESGHREEGVAALGVSVDEAVALGAHYGQEAIFVWAPDAWSIVSCRDERRVDFGWSVAVLRPM